MAAQPQAIGQSAYTPSTNLTESANPKTTSSDYRTLADFWRMVGSILHGVDALRAAGSSGGRDSVAGPAIPYASLAQLAARRRGRTGAESPYLPQFPAEDNADYEARRKNAPLTNIYADISKNLASKPFSKELQLDEKTPDDLKKLAQNIDGQGNNLHIFAAEVFKSGIDYAIDWILVDYTRITKPITLADERAMGARPYWVRVPATHLLAVYSDFINGQEVLTHARIYEPRMRRTGYDEELVESVREFNREPLVDTEGKVVGYKAATWRVWELINNPEAKGPKDQQTWRVKEEGVITIGIIPLVPFRTGKRDGCSWRIVPPLKDLAYLQIEEFQQESGLKNAKELTAFPMLTGNGVAPPTKDGQAVRIQVGPGAVLFAPPQMEGRSPGSWAFIEPGAQSLTFLANDLEKLRTEMRDLGMQPLATANLTVVTTANISMKAHSAIQAWALGLKDALEQALKITCMWLNRPNDQPVVKVHTDFGVDFEAGTELTALQQARTAKDLSRRTFWDELQRRGVLRDDFDPDAEDEELAKEQDALQGEAPIDPRTGLPISAGGVVQGIGPPFPMKQGA